MKEGGHVVFQVSSLYKDMRTIRVVGVEGRYCTFRLEVGGRVIEIHKCTCARSFDTTPFFCIR